MHIQLWLFPAVVCALSPVTASAQSAPFVPGPSTAFQLSAPLTDPNPRSRFFSLEGQGESWLGVWHFPNLEGTTIGVVPHAAGDAFMPDGHTCFTMRSYLFSHDGGSREAPRMTGYTTCAAAANVHARDAGRDWSR